MASRFSDMFVYVMSDGVNHKIGISNDPQRRAKSVSFALRRKVCVILSFACEDARGCELELHHRFKQYNKHKEWFRFPDMSFLETVWEVCTNNIRSTELFYAEGYKVSQDAADVLKILDDFCLVTYAFVNDLTGRKYNNPVLPQIMKRNGCIQISVGWMTKKVYITPRGIKLGLDKLPRKGLQRYLNVPYDTWLPMQDENNFEVKEIY